MMECMKCKEKIEHYDDKSLLSIPIDEFDYESHQHKSHIITCDKCDCVFELNFTIYYQVKEISKEMIE